MGLRDFIAGQFLEIIEWTDDSREVVGGLVGREKSEVEAHRPCVAGRAGVMSDSSRPLFEPGKWSLTTDNISSCRGSRAE
jgi:hypothetical protein